MANCCQNWIEISGDVEEVKKVSELVGKEFDFNKVIPTETDTKDEAIEKWGCGSIAFDTVRDSHNLDCGEISWTFWTKWNPPDNIYVALRDRFPNVCIYWRYEEPGNDLFGYMQNREDL
jgi:hypothetical protein